MIAHQPQQTQRAAEEQQAQGGGATSAAAAAAAGPAAAAAAALRRAVIALHSGGPAAAEANAWLNAYASSSRAEEALQASLLILAEFEAFCLASSARASPPPPPERRREEEAVAFFAANLLLTRVRQQAAWSRLSAAERDHVTAAAGRCFSASVAAGRASVARRLGAALAAAAALSGAEAVAAFAAQCLGALGGQSAGGAGAAAAAAAPEAAAVAWSALEALEGEIAPLDAARRRTLSAAAVAAAWEGVAERAAEAVGRAACALRGLQPQPLPAGAGAEAAAAAAAAAASVDAVVVRAAAAAEAAACAAGAWMRLESGSAAGAGARCRLSPGEFCGRHAPLAEALLQCIGCGGGGGGSPAAWEAAVRLEAAAADALALALGPSAAHPAPPPPSASAEQQQQQLRQQASRERAALTGALRGLCAAARPAALAPGPAGAATARAAALVAAAVAGRDPELAAGCGGGGGGVALADDDDAAAAAEVALAVASLVADVLVRRRERGAAAAAADYLLALNETPVASRAPELGAPLFGAAVRGLLRHTRLPRALVPEGESACGSDDGNENGGYSDDEEDEDEDEFWQLRDTVFAELAEASFGVVGPEAFFSAVAEGLRGGAGGGGGGTAAAAAASNGSSSGGGDWRSVENALWALKVVAAPARARANGGVGVGGSANGGGADVGAMLRRLFEEVCGGGQGAGTPASAAVADHPLAARQAAQALAAYAAWFGSAAADSLSPSPGARASSPGANNASPPPPSAALCTGGGGAPPPPAPPLEGALRLLLHAMGFPLKSGREASHAFRVLCTRCAEPLAAAGPGAIAALADAAAPRVAPPFDLASAVACAAASGGGRGGGGTDGGTDGGGGGGGLGRHNSARGAAPSTLSYEDRAAVFEGLARVAAALPCPRAVGDAGLRLLRPHLARAEAVVAAAGSLGGAPSSASSSSSVARRACESALADEVRLIGALMRAMDLPPSQLASSLQQQPPVQHPALRLLEGAWPLLSAAARSPLAAAGPGGGGALGGGGGELVSAAMAVFDSALQAARHRARPLLPSLLRTSREVFAATAHPAALRTLAVLIETFGEARGGEGAGELAAAQRAALQGALATSAAAVGWRDGGGAGGGGSDQLARLLLAAPCPERGAGLARALLAAGDAYLVFARAMLLSAPPALNDGGAAAAAAAARPPPPLLSALCQWATAALALREREPVSAALSFWSHLLGLLPKSSFGGPTAAPAAAAPISPADDDDGGASSPAAAAAATLSCAEAHGPQLVAALVSSLADPSFPRAALRPAASPLHSLLSSPALGALAGAWLVSALRGALVASAAAGAAGRGGPPLLPADVERFALLATRGTPAAAATGAPAGAHGGTSAAAAASSAVVVVIGDGPESGALPRRRFDALVADFAAIARGESTSDVLLGYEM